LIVSFLSKLLFFVKNCNADIIYKHGEVLKKHTIWNGKVYINGTITVEKDVLLEIKPGTIIYFKKIDIDNDGISESTIKVLGGTIKAIGTRDKPIIFTSIEANKQWGDWREILINHSKDIVFSYTIFEYGEYALHIHFSEGVIRNCIFRNNADGTRIGNSRLLVEKNLFENNIGKALNFTSSELKIKNNTIRKNRDGLFVFERADKTTVYNNNIYDNVFNVKVGDFFKGNLVLGETYIGDSTLENKIIEAKLSKKPFLNALPDLKEAYIHFEIDTNGFVDGSGTIYGSCAYLPSFDGKIYEIDLEKGNFNTFLVGDFIDASPVISENNIYIVAWDGSILGFDRINKNIVFKDNFSKTPKDDHRMASPILVKKYLIAISQGGNLKVFDIANANKVFDVKINGEFRATPYYVNDMVIFPSVDGRIYKLNLNDFSLNASELNGSFYSSVVFYKNYYYLLSSDGSLYKFDETFNKFKHIKLSGKYRYQAPVVFQDKLYIFSLDGFVHIVDENDRVIVKEKTNFIFTATPAIVNDIMIISTFEGEVVIYGNDVFYSIGNFGEIQFSPLVYKNKTILFGTRNNKIYGIKLW